MIVIGVSADALMCARTEIVNVRWREIGLYNEAYVTVGYDGSQLDRIYKPAR